MTINSNQITYEGDTTLPKELGSVVMACVTSGGKFIRLLFEPNGEPVTNHETAREVGNFFGYRFTKGKLDDKTIFLNIE